MVKKEMSQFDESLKPMMDNLVGIHSDLDYESNTLTLDVELLEGITVVLDDIKTDVEIAEHRGEKVPNLSLKLVMLISTLKSVTKGLIRVDKEMRFLVDHLQECIEKENTLDSKNQG